MPILDEFRVGAPVFLVPWQHMAMVPLPWCLRSREVGGGTDPGDAIIAPSSNSLPTGHGTGLAVPSCLMQSTSSNVHNIDRHHVVLQLARKCNTAWMEVHRYHEAVVLAHADRRILVALP